MRKFLLGTVSLVLLTVPLIAAAQVGISVNIGLPPPVVLPESPYVVVLPDTYDVYVVPYIDIDLFFWNGWWWRPWQGHWYRSRYYDRGWAYYSRVPRFYYDVDPRWRVYYSEHSWYGHPWYYERIDQRRLQRNWQNWYKTRHWEREQRWGVQGYQPRPQPQRQELRQQRQREYQQRPEVQQYQRQQQQRQPQVRQPQRQERERQPQVQPPPRQERERQPPGKVQQPGRSQPREKPEGEEREHRK